MTKTALITGASSGIGKEFARYHASKKGDLVLVARRADALQSLKDELQDKHGVAVQVYARDIGASEAAQELYDEVTAAGLDIDILINNAGFGGRGHHINRPLASEQAMVDLNVLSLMTLTHLFAADMAKRGRGRILNVGSTAGFMPGPKQAVYFATKAFVNSYSQALSEELRASGVTVTVLTPGYVETEFAQVADLTGTALSKSGARPETVARIGYDGMMKGRLVVFNQPRLGFALDWIVPLVPRRLMLKLVAQMQTKQAGQGPA
ncbi:SDR family oxidoreductase [Roseibium sp. RKSG952]|uniref:SDR family NAD(P)-dependent oxidoreductase n=1 Tax=Roseibium sp. RKSG952 TaxID=2529384 RepID=UPI0012BBDA20|nr:SDR family oxidoreductase [Roseibium sp. RKSG952]MTH96891.1 SDR family oxidoreductase [Roseibium sp. RKSG952]